MTSQNVYISPRLEKILDEGAGMNLSRMMVGGNTIWEELARRIRAQMIDRNFKNEEGESAWAPLSPYYAAYKTARMQGNRTPTGRRSLDTKRQAPRHNSILQWSGRLAVAARGGMHSFLRQTKNTLTLGIKGGAIPYAMAHQEGVPSKRLPQRKYLCLKSTDQKQVGRWLKELIIEALNSH